jgi:hypothetical protein
MYGISPERLLHPPTLTHSLTHTLSNTATASPREKKYAQIREESSIEKNQSTAASTKEKTYLQQQVHDIRHARLAA